MICPCRKEPPVFRYRKNAQEQSRVRYSAPAQYDFMSQMMFYGSDADKTAVYTTVSCPPVRASSSRSEYEREALSVSFHFVKLRE